MITGTSGLTNNALALDPGMAQYTLIPTEAGGALDDAYLYRLDGGDGGPKRYLLVVNALVVKGRIMKSSGKRFCEGSLRGM